MVPYPGELALYVDRPIFMDLDQQTTSEKDLCLFLYSQGCILGESVAACGYLFLPSRAVLYQTPVPLVPNFCSWTTRQS